MDIEIMYYKFKPILDYLILLSERFDMDKSDEDNSSENTPPNQISQNQITKDEILAEDISKQDIPKILRRKKMSSDQKQCQTLRCIGIFLLLAMGSLLLFTILFYILKFNLNNTIHTESVGKLLAKHYRHENISSILDFDQGNCKYGEKLKKRGLNAVCYYSSIPKQYKSKYEWVQNLDMKASDKNFQQIIKEMAKFAQRGLIIGWPSSKQYYTNKQIGKQIEQLVAIRNFTIDVEQTNKFQEQLQEWYMNNILVFKKSVIEKEDRGQETQKQAKQEVSPNNQVKDQQQQKKVEINKQAKQKRNDKNQKLEDPEKVQETVQQKQKERVENNQIKQQAKQSDPLASNSKLPQKIKPSLSRDFSYSNSIFNILNTLYAQTHPSTIGDFAGGLCYYAEQLKILGYQIQCYNNNKRWTQTTKIGRYLDMTIPQHLGKNFEWIQSLDVGESIPEAKSQNYINILTSHASKGIIVSWATPEQGYSNAKTNREVIALFQTKGFSLNQKLTIKYREIADNKYINNLFIFQKAKQNSITEAKLSEMVSRIKVSPKKQSVKISQIKSPLIKDNTLFVDFSLNDTFTFSHSLLMWNVFSFQLPTYSPQQMQIIDTECLQDTANLKTFLCSIKTNNKLPKQNLKVDVYFHHQMKTGYTSMLINTK